jgi:hypothetical protein
MPSTRRVFLRLLSLGALASAGFMIPRKLWARGRRSGSGCCPPSCCGSTGGGKIPYSSTSGDFVLYYPAGTSVAGGGNFYIWGVTKGVTIVATKATCIISGKPDTLGTPVPQKPSGLTPNGWAYMFSVQGVGFPVPATLKVEGMKGTGTANPGSWKVTLAAS